MGDCVSNKKYGVELGVFIIKKSTSALVAEDVREFSGTISAATTSPELFTGEARICTKNGVGSGKR